MPLPPYLLPCGCGDCLTAHLQEIVEHGRSRVPVFIGPKRDIVGILLVKHLLAVDTDSGFLLRDLPTACMHTLAPRAPYPAVDSLFGLSTA